LQAVTFWQCRFARKVSKVFHFMGLVQGKSFRFLVVVRGSQVFVMALVFMFNVILPELHKKVYYGRVGSQQQLASLQVHAQQSVHPTLGSLARFQAFFYASAFFQSDGVPPPAPARVTQTVSRQTKSKVFRKDGKNYG